MGRHGHHQHHGRPPDGRRDPGRADAAPREDAAQAVIALQRSAGNQAVGALLARAPKEDPRTPEAPEGPTVVTLGDIGPIRVVSVQLPAPTTGGAGPGSGKGREMFAGQLIVTAKVGPHSAAIARANVDGRAMDGVIEFGSGLRIKLTKAMVASYQVSGGDREASETWTLDAQGVEFVTRQPETEE
jgi:hypothetical protein